MRLLGYIGTILFLFSALYIMKFFGSSYEQQHPSLNEHATEPDLLLNNARIYAKDHVINRSLYHLEKAIESIRSLEEDIDLNSSEKMEEAIYKLETIYEEIQQDSLITKDMSKAFEYTLNTLTVAELRVSERYAESNKVHLAKVALKYAQLHLKNALNYSDSPNSVLEYHVYVEIDSMINADPMPAVLITEKIDRLIEEMDDLVVEKP